MSKKVVIIGAGGFAREVQDVFEASRASGEDVEVLGFIVEPRFGVAGTLVSDLPILGGFDWLRAHAAEVAAICAVGAPEVRRRLVASARAVGARFCSVIHPAAVLTRRVHLGQGVVITAGCILTNNIRLGDHVHLNLDCTVGHDSIIEDFATISPGVHVSGNVTLAEGCSIGTGANIIEKRRVGEWSVVGAGTTVIGDVPPNTTVVGVPGRVVKLREPGWHTGNT